MAGNPPEGLGDDFFEQILAVPQGYTGGGGESTGYGGGGGEVGSMPMVLQLGSGGGNGSGGSTGGGGFRGVGMGMGLPLGLNLEQGFLRHDRFREDVEANTNNNSNTNNVSSAAAGTSAINVSLCLYCGPLDFLLVWIMAVVFLFFGYPFESIFVVLELCSFCFSVCMWTGIGGCRFT